MNGRTLKAFWNRLTGKKVKGPIPTVFDFYVVVQAHYDPYQGGILPSTSVRVPTWMQERYGPALSHVLHGENLEPVVNPLLAQVWGEMKAAIEGSPPNHRPPSGHLSS